MQRDRGFTMVELLIAVGIVALLSALAAPALRGVIENARSIGENVLGPGLRELQTKHDVIGDVRGSGVFWALEFVADRETRTPVDAAWMGKLRTALFAARLVPFMADNRLHVVPPCVVTEDEARRGLAIIDQVLSELN